MSDTNEVIEGFGPVEQDAIGEIMNITMGSAATAVSNMLSAKVWITTPTVSIVKAGELNYPELEPSIRVKIEYTLGVSGSNVLILKQNDVQLILDQLMGVPLEVTDDFEFDEMNISAVCEVMNQMMGASATALSELIETPIDISTPQAQVQKKDETLGNAYSDDPEEYVCCVKFDLTIDGVINSEFMSVLSIDLAKEMASKMMASYGSALEEAAPEPASSGSGDLMSQEDIEALLNGAGSSSPSSSGGTMSQDEINALLNGVGDSMSPPGMDVTSPQPAASSGGSLSQEQINAMLGGGSSPSPAQPQAAPAMNMGAAQQMPQMPQMPQGNPQMAGYGAYPQGMPMQAPFGGYPQMGMPMGQYGFAPQTAAQARPQVNVQAVQLQSFDNYTNNTISEEQNDNLRLLMGVPLDIRVEIGSTKKKIKDILEFTQGTIIELERQAGAPVDVIVNGHLIAKGDVVVIDDNFAIRITEIIRSKFLDNLGKE